MECSVISCRATKNLYPDIILFPMPKQDQLRRVWLQRCGTYAENPLPSVLANKLLYVCQKHFDPFDYQVVKVKAKSYSQRILLNKDVLPHRNIPYQSRTEKYYYMTPDEDPLTLPVCSIESTHVLKDNIDHSGLNITPPAQKRKKECDGEAPFENSHSQLVDRGVSTDCESRSSIAVQCSVSTTNRHSQTEELHNRRKPSMSDVASSNSVESVGSSGSSYIPSHHSNTDLYKELGITEERSRFVQYNFKVMKDQSFKYLGIRKDNLFVLEALCETVNISERDIMIVLRKIKLNESFEILQDIFGLSYSRLSQIFNKCVPKISKEMEELIFWPEPDLIKKFLPVAFLNKYSNIQSVIDCFEIQVQKPSDPVLQSITYSQYKSCNTLKYLVSCTPCGMINFISKGFPGRASDQKIVNKSGYLSYINHGVGVLADRGFKNVASEVARKGGILIRPPSIVDNQPLSKEEAIQAKEIASVRIHVERLIRRFREYSICAPHAELPIYFFNKCDDIIKIVAGLVNLQGPLIK